jgi:hypothetical protein
VSQTTTPLIAILVGALERARRLRILGGLARDGAEAESARSKAGEVVPAERVHDRQIDLVRADRHEVLL